MRDHLFTQEHKQHLNIVKAAIEVTMNSHPCLLEVTFKSPQTITHLVAISCLLPLEITRIVTHFTNLSNWITLF